MDPYLRDVLDVCIRMLHVIAGIAWIGASFYFVRLDLALRPPKEREDVQAGVAGEFWGVHGGGLYHSQKYRLAPAEMPEPLHWFKWEAYTTWLSGFALLVVLYYFDADVRLVDPAVADLAAWQAVALSIGGLVLGVARLRRAMPSDRRAKPGSRSPSSALRSSRSRRWGAGELFAPRAAYLQVGAMLGTIMVANVLFVIIPAHRKLVAAMEDKREPDPVPLLRAKNRSVHNNYLTLPVLFTMLIGHFAFVFGADEAWIVFVLVAVLTAFIRVFFNRWHAGRRVVVDPSRRGCRRRRARDLARAGHVRSSAGRARLVRRGAERDHRNDAPHVTREPRHRSASGSRPPSRSRPAPTTSSARPCSRTQCRRGTRPGSQTRSASSWARGSPREVRVDAVLEITAGGFSFSARFEEEAAPATVTAFRRMLPLDSKIIHVRWSGEGGWIPMGDLDVGIGAENATRYPSPGELIFYPGGVSETELLLAYGYVAFASKAGALAGNHFATIVEGSENLRELGRRMLWEGAQDISFSER